MSRDTLHRVWTIEPGSGLSASGAVLAGTASSYLLVGDDAESFPLLFAAIGVGVSCGIELRGAANAAAQVAQNAFSAALPSRVIGPVAFFGASRSAASFEGFASLVNFTLGAGAGYNADVLLFNFCIAAQGVPMVAELAYRVLTEGASLRTLLQYAPAAAVVLSGSLGAGAGAILYSGCFTLFDPDPERMQARLSRRGTTGGIAGARY